jgi:hypothetical protein
MVYARPAKVGKATDLTERFPTPPTIVSLTASTALACGGLTVKSLLLGTEQERPISVRCPELESRPEDLPEPDPAIVLWSAAIEVWLAQNGRRKGERYLRALEHRLADEEAFAAVLSIRPTSEGSKVRRARQEAAALFRALLPRFKQALPEE